jgi:hypothetical protein
LRCQCLLLVVARFATDCQLSSVPLTAGSAMRLTTRDGYFQFPRY